LFNAGSGCSLQGQGNGTSCKILPETKTDMRSDLKKHGISYILILTGSLVILSGCSVEKNTLTSRTYHNITARYNVLFNAGQSFADGMDRIADNHTDDYYQVLPVFLYGDASAVSSAASDMDRTIEKCAKLISLHSITAKPEVKGDRIMSERERDFYSQKEYNVYVDDAYVLMGKAYFYKSDFERASMVFRQVQNDFRNEPSDYESRIWMARIYNETGQYKNAMEIFTALEGNPNFPEKLQSQLHATMADCYLKQYNYPQAIRNLEQAVQEGKDREARMRYYFVLGQMYEATGDLERASDCYSSVIRMNPPFEMAFNATIHRALTYQEGSEDASEIEKELTKMLRDDKYNDYQDQVYYALGEFYTREGDTEAAMEQYIKSVETDGSDPGQKVRSFLTIADHYFSIPDYVHAQAYYDSALSLVNNQYPDYNELMKKSGNLSMLVGYINTVAYEDSVQQLARLDRQSLYARIDQIIDGQRQKQLEEQQRQIDERLDRQFANEAVAENRQAQQTGGQTAQWYFYNETARSLGYSEFRLNWGNRNLEDHWQRANRTTQTFAEESGAELEAELAEEPVANQNMSRMSRDYYLAGIPQTDSALAASNNRIENALYNMGLLYKNELQDAEKANEAFRELLSRYPATDYGASANYNLYIMAMESNNPAMEQFYRDIIIRDYPGTMYAKVLEDPDYMEEMERVRQEAEQYYRQTYALYTEGDYPEVIRRADVALRQYEGDELLPQFAYLKVLASGREADREDFRNNLLAFISAYPGTEMADDARNVISYLDRETPEYREQEEKILAAALYTADLESEHVFAFVVDNGADVNQLIFNIINFNLDNYDDLNLRVDKINIGARQSLITVRPFRDAALAIEYLQAISQSEDVLKDVPVVDVSTLVISSENLASLREDGSLSRYMQFYNENYQ